VTRLLAGYNRKKQLDSQQGRDFSLSPPQQLVRFQGLLSLLFQGALEAWDKADQT